VDIAPWVSGAVRRNCPQGAVDALKYDEGGCTFLTVSMSNEMVPYIDDMIAKMDRPGKTDSYGSIVEGTSIGLFTYTPKHRASQNMVNLVYMTFQWRNAAVYLNKDTNVFYWKDSKAEGELGVQWLDFLDREPPEVELTMRVYEINDSDLIDLGIDYIHWKNGPGLEMLSGGLDFTSLRGSEQVASTGLDLLSKSQWAWGSFLVAPQFDASFIRMLQQRGVAKSAASGTLRVVNNSLNQLPNTSLTNGSKTFSLEFRPDFQNITKDSDMKVAVVKESAGGQPLLTMTVTNPTIFFGGPGGLADKKDHREPARLYFDFSLETRSQSQKDVMGHEMYDTYATKSSLQLECMTERLIGAYTQEYDVTQIIGVPFLKDVPVLKYLFSTSTRARLLKRYYVTVSAGPVPRKASLSEWAGHIVGAVDGSLKKLEGDLRHE
jgi:hypothetical protein